MKVPSSKACKHDVLMPDYCRGNADVPLASVRHFDAGSDQWKEIGTSEHTRRACIDKRMSKVT